MTGDLLLLVTYFCIYPGKLKPALDLAIPGDARLS